jgi:hypothetical protein
VVERASNPIPEFLPLEYRLFVSAQSRVLPADWQLYSFCGHEPLTTLESINSELKKVGLPDGFVVFGKTGDEDFLLFRDGAVYWSDAQDESSVGSDQPFATSFALFILQIFKIEATRLRKELGAIENELRDLTARRRDLPK